ncbi:MAG: capsular exopolysaccharide biosynthesis [Prolixibacteraceae bacterium]|nr:MAG: capsular exopolysaccharide biosynthesis [Prolixibacteraceae bacterium]
MDQNTFPAQDTDSILKIIKLIFRNIWIIVPFVVVAVGIAYVYNRFTVPSYYVSSTVLLKEDSNNNWSNSGTRFINYDLLSQTQNLQNEVMILQSYPIIEQTVKNLELEVVYYEYWDYQYYNAYKKTPFKVFIFKDHPQLIETVFDIIFNSDGSFQIEVKKQDATVYNYETGQKIGVREKLEMNLKGNIGEILETPDLKLLITLNEEENILWHEGRNFAFKLTTIWGLTNQFKYGLEFNIPDKAATIIEIGMKTSSVKLGEDIINELMHVYVSSKLEEKNHLANITIDYIEDQLAEVTSSLTSTEDNLKRFKAVNRAMNVDEQASRLSEQQLQLQNQLAELMVQKRYYDYIKEYNLSGTDENQIVTPASMGVADQVLNSLVEELATAQSQLDILIKNNQERNPMVNRLRIQIRNLKSTISENIASAERANDMAISEMQNRLEQLDTRISRLPATQIQLGGIERTFNLNDAIYNYLLEKQAEAKITKASNLSDIVVIEPAHQVGGSPVSPKYMFNYLIALVMGFTLPVLILIFKMLFKTTISEQEDIEHITNATILGKVFHYNNRKEQNVFVSSPGNKIAENFRTMRTNLNFALGGGASAKTILVSSCVSGEGKTFSALNIAAAYAQIGKRTLLINFDLRNSQSIIKNVDNSNGLSMFLSNEADLDEVIQKSYFKSLDVINAGPVPPNPLELMENERTNTLFNFLKENYDYIIIDTPPMAQVSDAFTLIQYADLNLIIVRYNVTKKKLLRLVLGELKNKNINNVYIILNDNKLVSEQMGYGYYNK